MRKIIGWSSLLCVLALYNSVSAATPVSIGTITFIEGVSDIARDNQEPVLISEQAPVYILDRIRTKSYSKAEVTLNDKSVIKLAPNTCISLEEFKVADNQKREFARVKLTRGKIETIVSKTGAPDTFVIDTPNAKGSVKGSDIFVSYMAGRTGVFVKDGAISVLNSALPYLKTHVAKGDCAFVSFDEAPGQARPTLDIEMSKHKKDVERALVRKLLPVKASGQMNGVIVSLAGEVRIYKKNASDWSQVKQNDIISEGDKLQTADDARAEVRLGNGNVLLVQSGTELSFSALRYDSASGNYQNEITLAKGRVSGVVGKITAASTFQIKTSTAVCGVRGTFIEVVAPVPTAQAPAPTTQVFFEGGNGVVTSTATGQTQEVSAGQNVNVDSLGAVSTPMATSAEQRSVMVGTWATIATVDSYATSPGTAGAGGDLSGTNTPIDNPGIIPGLPPKPPDDILPKPPDINPPQTASVIYGTTCNSVSFSSGYVIGLDSALNMYSDGTWQATITNGQYNGVGSSAWAITVDNSVDYFDASGSSLDNDNTWSATVTGSIYGTDPHKTLAGTASGTTVEDPVLPNQGTFSGTASGTWTDM
jgi:hypothetical protein